MKYLLLLLLSLNACAQTAIIGTPPLPNNTVTLAWDAIPSIYNVTNYVLKAGPDGTNFPLFYNCGTNLTITITNPPLGFSTYYFEVAGQNGSNTATYSAPLQWSPLPSTTFK